MQGVVGRRGLGGGDRQALWPPIKCGTRKPTFRLRREMPAARGTEKSEQGLNLHVKLSACHAEGRGFERRRSRQFDQAFSSPPRVAIQLPAGLRFNFLGFANEI